MRATVDIFNKTKTNGKPYPAIQSGRHQGVFAAVELYMDTQMSFLEKLNYRADTTIPMHLLKRENLRG
jgi:hypothetical protein